MDTNMLEIMERALATAEDELNKAIYLSESGSNAGIRKINSNKAEWLRWVVYLSQNGLEAFEEEERLKVAPEEAFSKEFDEAESDSVCDNCPIVSETQRLNKIKDQTIKDLKNRNEDLVARLNSLQLTYDCEVEYRKAIINKAIIDYADKVSKIAHDNCWLDGTFLVTPVEYLDRSLMELIKE